MGSGRESGREVEGRNGTLEEEVEVREERLEGMNEKRVGDRGKD